MAAERNVIAIVDDDPAMRLALEDLLSLSGYRTELYASAEEFITTAKTTEASSPTFQGRLHFSHRIHDRVSGREVSAAGYGSWLYRILA